ncbi:StAR-related lipid transfer protein 7, mitochondrial [Chionoecetes opilio]|uniref:StAR-related lipid transfer protein 7, mitochondrial n=1 Tax=Chionoecetes opilio TaxID=41210 RepID=A0A8J4XYY6_CHIOP|nr:StAR-related lipid transfer protein 7, mitochondrial [Chionoecetes opilio]
MLTGGGGSHLWPGRMRGYCRVLRGLLGRHPSGARAGDLRLQLWSSGAPWRAVPLRPDHTKGVSGVRRWSLLVLLVGQEGRVEVLGQAKEVMRYLLCMVARQSEVHASQKLRRALQLYSAYSRLWGEEVRCWGARTMLARLRRALAARGRHLLLSAVCFSNFNWEQEKISEDRLQESAKDHEDMGDLCRATVECHTCGKRQVIDQKMVDVDYCLCGGSLGYTDGTREYQAWRPFIEREHHIVWRRRHPVHNHLFAYKVYGSYDDVSLSSFMETQLNSSYRTEWDDTALQLKVLESHQDSNSDLMYWLVKFPVTGHRVHLTYFDNPGTSLPQSITNFVAMSGFPNYLKKLHMAALHLQSSHEKGDDVYVSLPAVLRYPRRGREDLETLPDLDVPSDEEVQVLVEGSEAIAVKEESIDILSEEQVSGETQDEHSKVISLPVTSATVEGSGGEIPSQKTHMQEEPSSTNILLEDDEIVSHVEDSPGSVEESISLSADPVKDTTSDKSLHVYMGGKNISVDLLEAMEVVAPDREKKSLLLRKIEDLNEMLEDDTKQSIILQKLRKLKHKLKSFQAEAVMKRERSMRHMEELSERDHYHHMSMDAKTLRQLELLFEAMKYVLQADRDMRTGKTLLEEHPATHHKAQNEEGRSKTSKNKNKANQESQPPKDPPPPASAGGQWREGETSEEADDISSEESNYANELGSIAESVRNVNNGVNESRSWYAGVSVPYISAWWEAGARQGMVPQNTTLMP